MCNKRRRHNESSDGSGNGTTADGSDGTNCSNISSFPLPPPLNTPTSSHSPKQQSSPSSSTRLALAEAEKVAVETTANFSRPTTATEITNNSTDTGIGINGSSDGRVMGRKKRVTFWDQKHAFFHGSSSSSNNNSSATISSGSSSSSSDDSSSSSSSDIDSSTTNDEDCCNDSVIASHYHYDDHHMMTKEELKATCWYSDEELKVSRQDAKETIQALQRGEHVMMVQNNNSNNNNYNTTRSHQHGYGDDNGNEYDNNDSDAAATTNTTTTTTTLPRSFCWRGVEKYVDAVGKLEQQRRLVGSVLHQQSICASGGPIGGSKEDHVALVSRTLSQPFKDLARHYAEECAQELREELRQERQEMERIKYLLRTPTLQKQQQRQQQQQHTSQPQTDASSISSVIGQKRRSLSKSHHDVTISATGRNVKHCIRRIIISE